MAETIETLIVQIDGNPKGLKDSLNSSGTSAKGLISTLKGIGVAVAAAFAVKQVLKFGNAITQAASDAVELQNKFDVVFKGISESTQAWIENYAAATSRGVQSTKEYLSTLQDIRTGYGDNIASAAKYSQAVIGVTNDLASFANLDFETSSAAVTAGLAGQFRALRKLGVGVNVAIVNQSAYAQELGKTWLEMSNLEKQEAVLTVIMNQSANAIGQQVDSWKEYNFLLGDAARTSQTFENLQKLFKQSITDSAAELGSVFLPKLTEMLKLLTVGMERATPYVKAAFELMLDGMTKVSNFLRPFTSLVNLALSSIGKAFLQLTGINSRVTSDALAFSKDRIKALENEKSQRIRTLREEADASKDYVGTVADLTEEELEGRKDALKRELELVKDTAEEEIKIREDAVDEAIDLIDQELEANEKAHDEKIKLIDEEYSAKIKLLDEETQAKIALLEAAQDEIDAEQDAVDLAEKRRKDAEELLSLQQAINEAETPEDRIEAEKDLSDFQRELRLEADEEARKLQKEALSDAIDAIEEQAKAEELALDEEQAALELALEEEYNLKQEALTQSKELLQEELVEFKELQDGKVEAMQDAYDAIEEIAFNASTNISGISLVPDIPVADQIAEVEKEYDDLIKAEQDKLDEIGKDPADTVKNIIDKLKAAAPEVLRGIGSLVTGALGYISTNGPQLLSDFVSFKDDLLESMIEFLPSALQLGVDIFTSIVDGIVTSAPFIVAALLDITEKAIEVIVEVLPMWIESGKLILMSIIEGIIAILPMITSTISTLLPIISSAITTLLPDLITSGVELLQAIIEGILTLLPVVVETTGEIVDTILKIIQELLPDILEAGTEILISIINGIVEVLPLLIKVIEDLIPTIVETIIVLLPSIIKAGMEILNALIDGIADILPMLIDFITELTPIIVKALIANLPEIMKAGWEIMWALLEGIVDIQLSLIDGVLEVMGELLMSIIETTDSFFTLGADLGEAIKDGFIEGLKYFARDAKAKLKSGITTVVDGAKDLLGINSPSKVFQKIGNSVDEGFALGIEEDMNSVAKAGNGLGNEAIKSTESVTNNQSTNVTNDNLKISRDIRIDNLTINNPEDLNETNRLFQVLQELSDRSSGFVPVLGGV